MSAVTVAHPHSLAQSFAAAGEVIGSVLRGESLNVALGELKRHASAYGLAAAAQDLCYNALRGYGVVDVALERLLEKPLADRRLRGLLLAGIAELLARPQSAHAVVHQAVEAAVLLGCTRAKGLVNGVLRNFQRRVPLLMAQIEAAESGRYRHPQWWIDALRAAYPRDWEAMLLESNRHPPMTLRVNRRRLLVRDYLEQLARVGIKARSIGADAVLLEKPCRVELLPGFAAGEVSVQDAGAQRAAPLLDLRDGIRVLDACAAPGGKTGHILELADCELIAVDADPKRVSRIAENLSRLRLTAKLVAGDCREPESFWEGKPFERILLDAPCSASGVVRRHPDIKWLRRSRDVAELARVQTALLEALWRVLAAGGKMLYATCSVFPAENGEPIREFLVRHPEARAVSLPGLAGGQILPGTLSDGFFYALLEKRG